MKKIVPALAFFLVTQNLYAQCLPPDSAKIIKGPTSVCADNKADYSTAVIENATSYYWTVPIGSKIILGQGTTSISVIFGSTSGQITVQGRNNCDTGVSTAINVAVNPLPAAATTIEGATSICADNAAIFSTPIIANAISYNWTVPNGSIIDSGQGTTSIFVTFGSISGQLSVQGENDCGAGNLAAITVTVNPLPGAATGINGPTFVCENDTETYSTPPIANATSYKWTVASGSVISGQGTPSISLAFGSSSGQISVQGVDSCGVGGSFSITVFITPLPGAATGINGSTFVCENDTETYSTPPIANATSYKWTVASGSVISGQGTPSISVAFGSSSGQISVQGVDSCGVGGSFSITVFITPLPGAATGINGSTFVCENDTETYSTPPIANATSYKWTVASGSVISGQGTPSISVAFGSSSGQISVQGVDSCGVGGSFSITVFITSLPGAATGINGSTFVCENDTETYSTPPIANATSYKWSIPKGDTMVVPNGTSITVIFGNASGSIYVHGKNSCGAGDSIGISVTVNPLPAPVIRDSVGILTSSEKTGNQWYFNGAIIQGATSNTYIPSSNGNYFDKVTSTFGCSATSNVINISFFSPELTGIINPQPNIQRTYNLDSAGEILSFDSTNCNFLNYSLSNLQDTASYSENFIPTSTTKYAEEFDSTGLALLNSNIYTFYKCNDNEWAIEGYASEDYVLKYKKPLLLFTYKLACGGSIRDSEKVNYENAGIEVHRTANVFTHYEGYGWLITSSYPNGVYVMRVHLLEKYIDSSFINSNFFGIATSVHDSYCYFGTSLNPLGLILRVDNFSFNTGISSYQSSLIKQLKPMVSGINNINIHKNDWAVFADNTTKRFVVSLKGSKKDPVYFTLYDLTGRILMRVNARLFANGKSEYVVPFRSDLDGLYLFDISDSEETTSFKLLLWR